MSRPGQALLLLSAALFALTGIGYLVVPGVMLSVVGIESTPTTDFLLRTEGVPLLCGAGLIWAARAAGSRLIRLALASVGAYYLLGSIVDLAAFRDGVVGGASVPSIGIRIALGTICLVLAGRRSDGAVPPPQAGSG